MINLSEFVTVLKTVSHAMAVKDVRYYLTGVQFVFNSGVLHLTALDGHRVCQATMDAPGAPDGSFIVTSDCIKRLLSTYKPVKGQLGREMKFEVGGSKLGFFDGWIRTDAELHDTTYPDVPRVLPKTEPTGAPSILIDAKYLADAASALKSIGPVTVESWDAATTLRLSASSVMSSLIGPVIVHIMPRRADR